MVNNHPFCSFDSNETAQEVRWNTLLDEAIQAACAGAKSRAAELFRRYVAENPDDAGGWIWLGFCVEDRAHATYCMRMAMELDPTNIEAARIIERYPQITSQ